MYAESALVGHLAKSWAVLRLLPQERFRSEKDAPQTLHRVADVQVSQLAGQAGQS